MNSRLIAVAAVVVLLVGVAAASPNASAEDAKEPPNTASLDELKATDAELTKAIADLDAQIATQQNAVNSAQQALDSANQMLQVNQAAFDEAQTKYDNLRAIAAERAVNEYMRPHGESVASATNGAALTINEINRREGFLREINDTDADAIDRVRALKVELDGARNAALQAQKTADERKRNEQQKLDELNKSREEKGRLDKSLQERIAVYAAEDSASLNIDGSGGRANRGGPDIESARISAAGMTWPANNRKVNSEFGTRWGRQHKGLDIQAGVGDPIYAVKAGTVKQAGWESGYGKYTCIDHGGGVTTCYAHQTAIAVSVGQAVQQGQQIGKAGNTGASQGAHLHFEIYVNGTAVNPRQFL